MKFSPYSIDRMPRQLPVWELLITDLGRPHPARIAKVLGVGTSTVYRWNKAGHAPRVACLALFWLTRWGRSEAYCAAVNDCAAAVGYANSLLTENHRLRSQLAHVLALNGTGAANEPLLTGGELNAPL
jgi:predicted DNA-binding transcriptional regulator AlpA